MSPRQILPPADTLHPPPPDSLEMPPALSRRAQDNPLTAEEQLLPPAEKPAAQVDPGIERRLKALRKSPGFALIAESDLLLRACQLDMDIPPSRHSYVRQQLTALLMKQTGKPLDPDQLRITFTTQTFPSVDDNGTERYSQSLSLTEVALATFDTPRFIGLSRSTIADVPPSEDATSPDAGILFNLIVGAPWIDDFTALSKAFWKRHKATYRALCKLGFLDELARRFEQKKISFDGYRLTLDTLGLRDFPKDAADIGREERGKKAEVYGLSLNGELIPGIFQVRSKTTSHCFIHVLGTRGAVAEYISDDPDHMTPRLLAALNDSGPHRRVLHMLEQLEETGAVVESSLIEGDVFTVLVQALEDVTCTLLDAEDYDRFDWRTPVSRGLALASAVDLWQAKPPILQSIPQPSKTATYIMSDYLKTHGQTLDPNQVFIVYRHGHATTPLGDARRPSIHVHVPDQRSVSLTEALMINYRVQYPAGYIDHGGRTLVYRDVTGKGVWDENQTLPIEPRAIEDFIKNQDFLTLMTAQIEEFWEKHRLGIEQAFKSILMGQALIGLKQNRLSRAGFDLIVNALVHPDTATWRALGFHIKGSLLDPMQHQYAGLLVLEQPGKLNVLYQAGHLKAFVEFADPEALHRYLKVATADERWRKAIMHHVPYRHHERLAYLLRVWARVQTPQPAVSLLRPWTDALYNPDTRQAMQRTLYEVKLQESPFQFMYRTLKQNALHDAEDQIVTSTEVTLRYWTSRLHQLQWLLAPMSILLTPALIASLATEIGVASLNIASAHLPGSRYADKDQALLTLLSLSLGLLHLGPQTPGLLRSLSRIMTPASRASRTGVVLLDSTKSLDSLLRRSMSPRQTRLEKFFQTDALLKRWTIAAHPRFGTLPVHVWKMGRRFLLWTSNRGQARTLVVSTHGHYMPWSNTVKIPNGTRIHTYAPHGYELVDPMLHRVVSKRVRPFAVSDAAGNTLVQQPPPTLPALAITDQLMAGTSLPGKLKNYTLSKFQTIRDEAYEDIANIVRNANASPFQGQLPPVPMDVLTVRNRFGMPLPTLADLFDTLATKGIHYDKILLVHCRCAAIDSLLRRAPVYRAPTVKPAIVKMP